MNHGSYAICSVCSQTTIITDRSHKCTEKFYSLITQIIQVKGDTPSFLDNITNLVFQGGGVKGIAYLGALEQLQAEGRLRKRDFLSGIKRIAGTSAGSIVALYLGLNMDVDKEIRPLMEKEYSELLDDGLVLKVAINPGGVTIFGQSHKNFKVKHIILQALEYFAEIDRLLKSGNTKAHNEAEKDLKKAINRLFSYYGTKVGFIPALAIKIKASDFAADATKWLLSLLKPPETKTAEPVKRICDPYSESVKRSSLGDASHKPPLSYTVDPYSERIKRTVAAPQNVYGVDQTGPLSGGGYSPFEKKEFGNEQLSYSPDYASTNISESSSFEDIINGECSGFLSESDQLDLSLSVNRSSLDSALRSESPIAQMQYNSGNYTTQDILRSLSPTPNVTNHLEYSTQDFRRTSSIVAEPLLSDSIRGSTAQKSGSYPNLYNGESTREYLNDNVRSKRVEIPVITKESREGPNPGPLVGSGGLNASLYGGSPAHIENIVREARMQAQQYLPRTTSVEMTAGLSHNDNHMTVPATPLQNPVLVSQQSNGGLLQGAIVTEEGMPAEKQTTKAKQMDAEEYIKRYKSKIAAAPKDELTRDILPYALGELLWFCIISQQNAAGVQEKLGMFDGSVVTKELIEKPIVDRLIKLGLQVKSNITFKELMDYNVLLPEEKKFKKFYVTAFNTETSKTEVFSVEHTPNVVIADAVRASMSIPVFFTPVTIKEKNSLGHLQERKYWNGNVVNYMDGGVLDNYPMWIFDDIKYCFDETFQIPSNMRCSIQNPNTLGFRLLDDKTIEKYTNPRFVGKEDDKKFQDKFSYQMGLLAGAFMSEAQENEHVKRGDCTRSVYVDNLGVSAIKFSLSKPEKANLIESGRQSVRNYKLRAAKNFNGEGQIH